METPTLILSFFALGLISIIGLSLSSARVEIRTLKARLDRRDALDAKNRNPVAPKLLVQLERNGKEIEALEVKTLETIEAIT